MAIYTPTGLKIRLPVPYAFALMSQLEQRVTPFRLLMTTEGIELVPNMLRLATALMCFHFQQSFAATFLWCVLATIVGMLLNVIGAHRVPGLVRASTIYSFVNVWEICTVAAVLLGSIVAGWQVAAAYCLSCAAGWVLGFLEEYVEEGLLAAHVPRVIGIPLVGAERSFINAYRYHATRTGLRNLIHENDASIINEGNWKDTLVRFDASWPQVAMQFDFGND
ncbi:MAG: hypothetical protein IT366_11590 [Candidatus Hydrogenedentes bacterium]|nr:hypothetical protein [Candidatus Hydrogenedentota bacterium]